MEIKFTRPQDAVAYAQDKGLTIFPICPSGSTKAGKMIDKTPAIPKWIEWAESTPRPKVLNYAKTNKMANFGVHCGLSGIVIVDVDVKEGQEGLATLAALEEKYSMCFGDTFTVRTPSGGFHYYFRNTSTRKITGGTCKLGPGIDVQAGNKYAVMFGSEIEDGPKQIGGKYTIINDAPMAALPDWIRDEIVTKVTKDVNTEGKIETPELDLDQPENIARAVEFLKTTDQICVEGSEMGGEYLYQIFLQVRDMGISEAFTRELVSQHYNERCEPPWDLSFGSSDLDHFSAKLANAYKYAQHSNPGAKTHEAKQIEHQEAFGVDPSLVILDKIVEPPNTLETMQGDVKLSSEPKLEDEYQGEAPVREWLVHEWIPLNEISSLYGAGGAGKSLLALQLGKAIANGIPFMNMEIPTPVPVLYVACEDSDAEIHRRIQAIRNAPEYSFDAVDPQPLALWSRVGLLNDIATDNPTTGDVQAGGFKAELITYLKRMPPGNKLLILDTLSDVYLGDENTRAKVNKFVKFHIGGLAIKFNLTVLLLAHPSRSGANIGDMLSGSTAWNAAVRNRLIFTPSERNEECMTLTRFKSNYAKSGESLDMEWQHGRFVPVDTADMTTRAMDAGQRDVLHALKDLYKPGDVISISKAANTLESDPNLSHLFAGKVKTTIQRKIRATLQYTRSLEGIDFSCVQESRAGERANWFIHVTTAEEGNRKFKDATPEELADEEARLGRKAMVSNINSSMFD